MPSLGEWITAALAAALICVVGAALLVRPMWAHATGAPRRMAGLGLGVLAVGMLLGVTVLLGAGIRAAALGEPPVTIDEPFASRIIDDDPDITEDIALFATALLFPLGSLLAVVALAVLRLGTTGIRVVAAGICGLCVATSAVVVLGDAGSVVTRLAAAVGAVALVTLGALLADELHRP
ncbi:MAG: hypothetical protein ACRD0G_18155 [Acidimicrobiales bacterium]